ncbi:MAG: ABC transporter permease, partial [Bacteroidota bacterium]|nr:ABC transporter permease [Bacteroidota bacterium]
MFQNYLKIAWRHLGRNRGYTAINIAGLSIGMAIALVIGLWISDEASFDHYAPNHSRLAAGWLNMRLNNATKKKEFFTGQTIMMPLGNTLSTKYKDLFSRVAMTEFGSGNSRLFNYGDKTVTGRALTAQADLPGMFGFRMIYGQADATREPSTILIAQSLAKALFGNGDPVGKTVKVDNTLQYRVGGTYADLPKNTTFSGLQAVLPWANAANGYRRDNTSWQDHNGHLFVELAPGVSAEQATARVKDLPTPQEKNYHEEVLIYPLDKAHLYNQFEMNKPAGGRITMVWLFGIIGAFVLLLACINFMNLSTARSEKRAKEVGIRKTIGSLRRQLIGQFLSESVLLAVIALFFALVLAQVSLPFFNDLAAKQMSIPWTNPVFILAMVGFTSFTGLLA